MSASSKIEWTDATWNPVRGCTPVSPGCDHCYAKRFAERFRGVPGHPYERGFDVRLVPEKLTEPWRRRKPRMVLVNSMSDLFHEDVPDDFIATVISTMRNADRHTYQVLTKRAKRMRGMIELRGRWIEKTCPHVWWGVSVENREHGFPRIADLQATPVAVRFLSIEPLLEPLGTVPLAGIHWVIVGGETGPGARPMHPDWVRSIRDQCIAEAVPFFFKGWGEWCPPADQHAGAPLTYVDSRHGQTVHASSRYGLGCPCDHTRYEAPMVRVGKKRAGRELDGRTHDEFPVGHANPA